jgi:hypothetical protein
MCSLNQKRLKNIGENVDHKRISLSSKFRETCLDQSEIMNLNNLCVSLQVDKKWLKELTDLYNYISLKDKK